MRKRIGRMLAKLRADTGATLEEIARGVVSVAELSRIETGEKEADWILLEALFERMGKSIDKLEMVVTMEEYTVHLLRKEILEALTREEKQTAGELLSYYEAWLAGAELLRENGWIFFCADRKCKYFF